MGLPGEHDAAGKAEHGRAVIEVAHEEHGTRKHRRSVGHHLGAGTPDGARGVVVRVHAHAARADDEVDAPLAHAPNRSRHIVDVVAGQLVRHALDAKGRELALDHRRELVLDEPRGHLAARRDDADAAKLVGHDLAERIGAGSRRGLVKDRLLDDEGDDAHAGKLVAGAHRRVAMARRDHDLLDRVHLKQSLGSHAEAAVMGGLELDLALLDVLAMRAAGTLGKPAEL